MMLLPLSKRCGGEIPGIEKENNSINFQTPFIVIGRFLWFLHNIDEDFML